MPGYTRARPSGTWKNKSQGQPYTVPFAVDFEKWEQKLYDLAHSARDPRDYGSVDLSGTNDSSSAMQAAFDDGGLLLIPPNASIKATGLILRDNLHVIGPGHNNATIFSDSGDVITTPSSQIANGAMSSLTIQSNINGGHCFAPGAGGLAKWRFENVFVKQNNAGKSLWSQSGSIYVDVLWQFCELEHVLTPTVPGFVWTDTINGANANRFLNTRCTFSGEYFFLLQNTGGLGYSYDFIFKHLTMENTLGGNIKVLGGNNLLAEHVNTYDLSAATTRDLFFIGKHATGLRSLKTTIRKCDRRGGTLGGGLADILISDAYHTTIEDCGNAGGSAYVIDCNSNPYVDLKGIPDTTTILNKGATTVSEVESYGTIIGGGAMITRHLSATKTWDPANILNTGFATTTITVSGAAVGDTVTLGFSTVVPAGMFLVGAVTAADTVTVSLLNMTGGAVDLASGTLRADVWKH